MLDKIIKKQAISILLIFISMIVSACVLQPVLNVTVNEHKTQTLYTPQGPYTVAGDHHYPAFLLEADIQARLINTVQVYPKLAVEHQPNIWDRIRDNFELAEFDHPRIQTQFNWYSKHPDYINRVAQRAIPYLYFIIQTIEEQGIPSEIALLPIVESAFKPFAYSHGRASGIWQFIPSTGRLYGLKQNWWYDGRRDVYASTKASIKLLKNLAEHFNGDWMLALAAYNSGQGTVARAIKKNKKRGRPTDFFSLHLPPETRAYVPKLLALKRLIANPELYNLDLLAIPDEPYFTKVEIGSQIDLALAATLANISVDEIYKLNPGFNRWATAPNGPHYLLMPNENVEIFRLAISELSADALIKWKRHHIRKGETIGTIARKYHTSISVIKRSNHLRSNRIREGHKLLIPVASKRLSSYKLSANQRIKQNQNIKRKGEKITYIIRAGDTWWALANQYGVGVRQLAKWNSLAPRDRLRPGQKIIIWARKNTLVPYDSIISPPNRTQRIGYRVRRGDSLSRISKKFRVSIKQIKRWNKRATSKKYLQPGQRLTLYIDVTRQSS